MSQYYDWIKAFHIIAMTTWMAGMFYFPRLLIYHLDTEIGGEDDKRFQLMEKRLMRAIMNTSMIITLALGLSLVSIYGFKNLGIWFHIKSLFVLIIASQHGYYAFLRKKFEKGERNISSLMLKIINESTTIAFIIIVILVTVKPFE